MLVTADRVKETTTTTGTGSYTLAGAVAGFRSFLSGIANGNTCDYCCTDGTNWEVGVGTLSAGTTLDRTSIIASSNAGAAVSWGAGSKDIFATVSSRAVRDSRWTLTDGLTATGTNQGTALALTDVINGLSVVTAGTGVLLPPAKSGSFITVMNHGVNPVLIYPSTGETVEGGAVNVALQLPAGNIYRAAVQTDGAWVGVDINPYDDENSSFNIGMHPTVPPTPASGFMRLFGRSVGGRSMLSMMGASGLDTAVQPFIARNKVCFWNPAGNATTITAVGAAALTATGTATIANVATTNIHTWQKRLEYLVTVAATTAIAGFRNAVLTYGLGNQAGTGGFTFVCRFAPATGNATATKRCFVGMHNITTAQTDAQPSSLTNILGCGYDSADANWQIMYSGAGATTKVDTGIARPSADRSDSVELAMFTAPNSQQVSFQFTDNISGATFYHTATTNLPSNTTLLAPRGWVSAGGTSSVIGIALMGLYCESDL